MKATKFMNLFMDWLKLQLSNGLIKSTTKSRVKCWHVVGQFRELLVTHK